MEYECASSVDRHLALAVGCGVVALVVLVVGHNKRGYVCGR